MVWRNLMSTQKSSVEHLFRGLFQIAESCSRPVAISMWEIKGVHYSLEGRKTVLRESLWLPLSAFSPAIVTRADSGCFFLQCSLLTFLSHRNNLRVLQRAARVVPGVLMLWPIARTLFHIFLSYPWITCLNSSSGDCIAVFLQAQTECIFKMILLLCCFLPGWDEGTELYR